MRSKPQAEEISRIHKALQGATQERQRMEEDLKRERDFVSAILDTAGALVVVLDRHGQIVRFNRACERATGYTFAEVKGKRVWDLFLTPDEAISAENVFGRLLSGQFPVEFENTWLTREGNYRQISWSATAIQNKKGMVEYVVKAGTDVTDHRRQEEQLAHLASHDLLTGLVNRRGLEDVLKRVISRSVRGVRSTLVLMDLDHFKIVNDTLGHFAGDQVLVTLSQILQGCIRTEDVLARLSGDEFAVVLDGTGLEAAQIVAQRTRHAVDDFHFNLEDRSFHFSLSLGLIAIDGDHTPSALLSRADVAMFKAKEQGRNRLVVYRSGEGELDRISEAGLWTVRLKNALQNDRFLLHFQPVVDLKDGTVSHYESLIRMRGDQGEIIAPSAFVPAAERFGLMPEITRYLVIKALKKLTAHPGVRLFVNLSGSDLSDETLPDFVAASLRKSKVKPQRLGFEITETTMIQNLSLAERCIRRLKALGCRFALDDFGVGFNSFARLRSLPVDHIKIDGAFIRTLDTDPTQRAVVQAMHTLAQALDKETVAEFVENDRIVRVLKEIGVSYGQGYYLGKPQARLPRKPGPHQKIKA